MCFYYVGYALETMRILVDEGQKFDFIFVDAVKSEYIDYVKVKCVVFKQWYISCTNIKTNNSKKPRNLIVKLTVICF